MKERLNKGEGPEVIAKSRSMIEQKYSLETWVNKVVRAYDVYGG